jgi:hypothetical protein
LRVAFTVIQNKTLDPLHILLFGTNAIVLDANTLADLIQEFWRCVFSLHKRLISISGYYNIGPNGLREWHYTPTITILYTPEKVST